MRLSWAVVVAVASSSSSSSAPSLLQSRRRRRRRANQLNKNLIIFLRMDTKNEKAPSWFLKQCHCVKKVFWPYKSLLVFTKFNLTEKLVFFIIVESYLELKCTIISTIIRLLSEKNYSILSFIPCLQEHLKNKKYYCVVKRFIIFRVHIDFFLLFASFRTAFAFAFVFVFPQKLKLPHLLTNLLRRSTAKFWIDHSLT